jgi:hypothetical protein
MAYPAAIHSYTAVDGTTLVADAGHAAMHNAVGSAVTQIETTIGTNSGTAVLKNATDGKFAVMNTGGTLDAGVLGTPMVRGGTIGSANIGTCTIQGGTVNSKIGLLTNGTIGTTLVGTSTIQGGTANSVLVNTSDLRGFYCTPQYATCAGTGGTMTLDLSLTNEWRVTFGTANGTLAVTGGVDGQKFIVSLTQDAVGTRTVVWFPTIKWPSDGTPTLTTTASKRDTFGFAKTGAATFDGFIVGANL